jgi:Skp family chaperone for outer membrane proteins
MGLCASPFLVQAPGRAAPAAQGAKKGPSSIAMVDVGYLLKNHPTMNARMEEIKAEMARVQEEIESRRSALVKENEALGATYQSDTPEYKQKQESLITAESKLKDDFKGKEKEFADKQAAVIYDSAQSINKAITLIASDYDLVLRYNRDQNEMDPSKPQSINFSLQRDVLYHNAGIDLTEMVLAALK